MEIRNLTENEVLNSALLRERDAIQSSLDSYIDDESQFDNGDIISDLSERLIAVENLLSRVYSERLLLL